MTNGILELPDGWRRDWNRVDKKSAIAMQSNSTPKTFRKLKKKCPTVRLHKHCLALKYLALWSDFISDKVNELTLSSYPDRFYLKKDNTFIEEFHVKRNAVPVVENEARRRAIEVLYDDDEDDDFDMEELRLELEQNARIVREEEEKKEREEAHKRRVVSKHPVPLLAGENEEKHFRNNKASRRGQKKIRDRERRRHVQMKQRQRKEHRQPRHHTEMTTEDFEKSERRLQKKKLGLSTRGGSRVHPNRRRRQKKKHKQQETKEQPLSPEYIQHVNSSQSRVLPIQVDVRIDAPVFQPEPSFRHVAFKKKKKDNARSRRRQRRHGGNARSRRSERRKKEREEKQAVHAESASGVLDFSLTDLFSAFPPLSDAMLAVEVLGEKVMPLVRKWSIAMCTFTYQMYRASSSFDYLAAITALSTSICPDIFSRASDFVAKMVQEISDLWSRYITPRAESFSDTADTMNAIFSTFVTNPLLNSLRLLILGLVSFRLFSRNVAHRAHQFLGRPAGSTFADAIAMILKGISYMLRFAQRLRDGTSITDAVMAPDSVLAYLKLGRHIKEHQHLVYTGIPVEYCEDEVSYMAKVSDFLENVPTILTKLTPYDTRFDELDALNSCIKDIYLSKLSAMKSRTRIPPFGLVLSGPPGIGKSKLLEYVACVWSQVKGRVHDPSHVFTRCKTSDYWEQYNCFSHPIIHYSEMGNMSTLVAKTQGDPLLSELQSVIDGAAFPADMAFDLKGKMFLAPEMVLIDTNNPGMHVDDLMYSPSAIRRRFLYLSVDVLPQYRKQGSTALDPELSLEDDSFLLDRYSFTLQKFKPEGNQSRVEYVMQNGNLEDMTRCLSGEYERHIRGGQQVNARVDTEHINDHVSNILNGEQKYGMECLHLHHAIISSVQPRRVWRRFSYACYIWWLTMAIFVVESLLSLRKSSVLGSVFVFNPQNVILAYVSYACLPFRILWLLILLFSVINSYVLSRALCSLISLGMAFYLRQKSNEWRRIVDRHHGALRGDNPLENYFQSANWRVISTGVATLLSLVSVVKLYQRFSTQSYKPQAHTQFAETSPINEEVNDLEEKMGCDYGYKRVKNKTHECWTTVYHAYTPIHTDEPRSLWNRMSRNLRRVTIFFPDNKTRTTTLFGIQSSFAVINSHALDGLESAINFCVHPDMVCRDVSRGRMCAIEQVNVVNLGNDVSVIRVPMVFSDVMAHIAQELPECAHGSMVDTDTIYNMEDRVILDDEVNPIDVVAYSYVYTDHYYGMCGFPAIAKIGNGSAVIGIHSGAVNNDCVAVPLYADKIEEAISQLSTRLFTPMSVEMESLTIDPNPKSPFLYEDLTHIDYFGTLPGNISLPGKSKVTPSLLSDDLPDFFQRWFEFTPQEDYAPPKMRPRLKNGVYQSPYNVGLLKMNVTSPSLSHHLLKVVSDELSSRIITMLRERGIEKLTPLTLDEAINGIDEDDFTRRINVHTSAGYGFDGQKEKYLPLVSSDDTKRDATPMLKRRILDTYASYRRNSARRSVKKVQLKDEPRPVAKVAKSATRFFYIEAVDVLVMAKQLLSPLYTRMVEHGDIFCTAVGINMHRDSDRFVKSLLDFSPLIMEGDYSGYDVQMPLDIGLAANTVILTVLKDFGYTDLSLTLLKGFMTDSLFPLMALNNDLFCKPGLQPSGKYGTACDNSLRGVIMLMYAWYATHTRDEKFFDFVKPVVYGDDLLVSVKPEKANSFNNIIYSELCLKHFGMTYTTASKTLDFQDFVDVSLMSFLKRTFEERNGHYVGKLSLESIYKSLFWFLPSKVSEEDQLIATCQSMIWEIYFHCDTRAIFEERRNALIALLHKHRITPVSLPSFNEIHHAVGDIRLDNDTSIVRRTQSLCRHVENSESYIASLVPFLPERKMEDSNLIRHCVVPGLDTKRAENKYNVLEGKEDFSIASNDTFVFRNQLVVELQDIEREIGLNPNVDLYGYSHSASLRRDVRKNPVMARLYELAQRARTLKLTIEALDYKSRRKVTRYNAQADMAQLTENEVKMATFENFTDMAGLKEFHENLGDAKTLNVGQSQELYLDDTLERFVEVDAFFVAPDTNVSREIAIWDLYSKNPLVRAKLRNYAFFKADLEVRVAVTGSPFHASQYLISYQPYPERNASLQFTLDLTSVDALNRPSTVNYLSQSKGCIIDDVRNNSVSQISIPFISMKPTFRLYNSQSTAIADTTSFDDFKDAGSVFFYTINTVRAPAGAADVEVQVLVRAIDVELGPPTGTVLAVTTESDEREIGPIETFATNTAQVLDSLSSVPVIQPFAQASAKVAKTVAGVAAAHGWSKPISNREPEYVKNEPFRNGANMIGTSTAKRITWDPKQEIIVDPRVGAVQEDEMMLHYLCAQKSYLTSFTWDPTDPPHVPIFNILNDITLCTHWTGIEKHVQPTPMALIAAMFQYWRADIEYTFEFVVNRFDRGKIMFMFEPNISQQVLINSDLDMNKQFTSVIDLENLQSHTLRVEWASPRPFLRVRDHNAVVNSYTPNFLSTTSSNIYSNGYLIVAPFTGLSNNDGSAIQVNVFVRAIDAAFAMPVTSKMPVQRFSTESDDGEYHVLNPTGATLDHIYEFQFGERVVSLTSLFKRMITVRTESDFVGGGVSHTLELVHNIWPEPKPSYAGDTEIDVNFLNYVQYAFLAMRGSLRFRTFTRNGTVSIVNSDRVSVNLEPPNGALAESFGWVSTPPIATDMGTVSFMLDTNAGVEFEVPFYNPNLFLFSCSEDGIGPNNTHEMMETYVRQFQVLVPADSSQTSNFMTIDRCTGEDWRLFRFLGAPSYTFY